MKKKNVLLAFSCAARVACAIGGIVALRFTLDGATDLSLARSSAGFGFAFASFIPIVMPFEKMGRSIVCAAGIIGLSAAILGGGFALEQKYQSPKFQKAQNEMVEWVKRYSLAKGESVDTTETVQGVYSGEKEIGASTWVSRKYTNPENGRETVVMRIGRMVQGQMIYSLPKTFEAYRPNYFEKKWRCVSNGAEKTNG